MVNKNKVENKLNKVDRNIHCFQTGCIQSQSGWMKRMNLAAMTGAWIVDVYTKRNGYIDRIEPKLIPYY